MGGVKAFEGLRPSFSAHIRWGESGAPIGLLGPASVELENGQFLVDFCEMENYVWMAVASGKFMSLSLPRAKYAGVGGVIEIAVVYSVRNDFG